MSKEVEWSSIHGKGELNMNPYRALADAIIIQACEDYRNALNELLQDPLSEEAYLTKYQIEQFFHSDWFATLTDIDPEILLEKLKKDIILTRIVN